MTMKNVDLAETNIRGRRFLAREFGPLRPARCAVIRVVPTLNFSGHSRLARATNSQPSLL